MAPTDNIFIQDKNEVNEVPYPVMIYQAGFAQRLAVRYIYIYIYVSTTGLSIRLHAGSQDKNCRHDFHQANKYTGMV